MKKLICLLFIFSLVLGQEYKLKISILDLSGEGLSSAQTNACFNQLETSLIESKRFVVIEKNSREDLLQEQKEQLQGCFDEGCAVDVGKMIGADYLVLGSIINLQGLYQINIKIVDIEKGDVLDKVTRSVIGDMAQLLSGMEDASREIVRKIAVGSPIPFQKDIGEQFQGLEIFYGSVDIVTDPPGANIIIDGVERGLTPMTIDSLVTGSHRMFLVYPGYETLQKGIKSEEGKTITISEVLLPKTGSLTLITKPTGANVYINNVLKGKTPFNVSDILVKDYIVMLALKDYETVTRRLTVQYNEDITHNFSLDPLPGDISVITFPEKVNIRVGDKKYKSNNVGMVNIQLPVGKHKLIFNLKGYENTERFITLVANEKTVLEVNLKKLPAGVSSNPDLGFLTINTYNLSAQAKVKGISATLDLPIEYLELKYGSHPLRVFQSGYETKKLNVSIAKQKTTTIEVNLKRKSARKALRYSIIPGGGQFYAENKTKAAIFPLVIVGFATLLNNSYSLYQDEEPLISQYKLEYQLATDPNDIDQNWNTYQNQVNTVNDLQTQLMIYGGALAVTWIANIIDAYFFSGLLE